MLIGKTVSIAIEKGTRRSGFVIRNSVIAGFAIRIDRITNPNFRGVNVIARHELQIRASGLEQMVIMVRLKAGRFWLKELGTRRVPTSFTAGADL